MNSPRSPQGERTDIMDLDRDIEALRLGAAQSPDRGLTLLLEMRDSVDRRAATLLGHHHHEHETSGQPLVPVAAASSPRRRRHRWAVVPIAGAVVLASTGAAAALSASPHAPLYPLHQLIFGANSNSDGQIGRDLGKAQILLNHAAAEPYAGRAGDLAQVHTLLADAQRLLLEAGSDRFRFAAQLAAERSRLTELEAPPTPVGPRTAPTPSPTLTMPTAPTTPTTPSEEAPAALVPSEAVSSSEGSRPPGESETPDGGSAMVNPPATEAPDPAPSSVITSQAPPASDSRLGSPSEPTETEASVAPDN